MKRSSPLDVFEEIDVFGTDMSLASLLMENLKDEYVSKLVTLPCPICGVTITAGIADKKIPCGPPLGAPMIYARGLRHGDECACDTYPYTAARFWRYLKAMLTGDPVKVDQRDDFNPIPPSRPRRRGHALRRNHK